MPLYEYQCSSCGQTFEVLQRFSDLPLTSHEGCGGSVKRLLSAPALQFKGTGWYVTDYGRDSANGSRSKERDKNASAKSDETGKKTPEAAKPADSKASSTPT
jgi:putative FmdB family regulatory protein